MQRFTPGVSDSSMKKKSDKRHPSKPQLASLWHALDEAAFGSERTLNLRESLPSAAEARARAEVWLRSRQVTGSREVLVITGRGNQSAGGVGVIRQEILQLLPSLRRKGIVESWREHSPGSVVIKLASVSSLFSAARRKRDVAREPETPALLGGLRGIATETLKILRQLAVQNLQALGVLENEQYIDREMRRTFSVLAQSLPEGQDRAAALHAAIVAALDESGM